MKKQLATAGGLASMTLLLWCSACGQDPSTSQQHDMLLSGFHDDVMEVAPKVEIEVIQEQVPETVAAVDAAVPPVAPVPLPTPRHVIGHPRLTPGAPDVAPWLANYDYRAYPTRFGDLPYMYSFNIERDNMPYFEDWEANPFFSMFGLD